MTTSAAPPSPEIGDENRRRRIRVAFGIFVAVQLVVPLSYYTRSDRYDERFAWRMFSTTRVESCATHATEVKDGRTRPIALARTIHYAWIEHFSRNRRKVIERFLEVRCHTAGVDSVTLENACRGVDAGSARLVEWTRDCRTGVVHEVRRARSDPHDGDAP